VVPPYPFCIEEDRHDVPMEDCCYARPQLFLICVLRSKDGRLPKNRTYKTGPDDIVYTLVFFSTFEELKLPIKGPMEDAGRIKLYEPSPTHCFYVANVQNMVGRVPLMPLFLAGNSSYSTVNSNNPSHIQQAQGFRLPVWLCRRCCNRRTAGQQCL
jgi:hypothetical protein